jgi:hypothetical protein
MKPKFGTPAIIVKLVFGLVLKFLMRKKIKEIRTTKKNKGVRRTMEWW